MNLLAKVLTLLIIVLLIYQPVSLATTTLSPALIPQAGAKLTEAHGNVFKRGFIDWTKESWGEPEPAQNGDLLREGMQIGTGEKSWAQVSWPNVTTRAWSNTVFAIAPNQKLIYLMGGELLFRLDKHRKDKKDYLIWTKVLQARVRGTTVLVQSTKDFSRICVLEGTIDVLNRINHSVVRITPGVILEIRTSHANLPEAKQTLQNITINKISPASYALPVDKETQTTNSNSSAAECSKTSENQESTNNSGSSPNYLHNITQELLPVVPAFTTKTDITNFYTASADNLLEHPLVKDFTTPLASLPLIKSTFLKLPLVCHGLSSGDDAKEVHFSVNQFSNSPLLDHTAPSPVSDKAVKGVKNQICAIVENIQILSVPTKGNYEVGPNIGIDIQLPKGSLENFPPTAALENNNISRVIEKLPSSTEQPQPKEHLLISNTKPANSAQFGLEDNDQLRQVQYWLDLTVNNKHLATNNALTTYNATLHESEQTPNHMMQVQGLVDTALVKHNHIQPLPAFNHQINIDINAAAMPKVFDNTYLGTTNNQFSSSNIVNANVLNGP